MIVTVPSSVTLYMCTAESAAENLYENAQAANANHDNVFTNRSPVRGELSLHLDTDGCDHFTSRSP